jgi:hypothetical protein
MQNMSLDIIKIRHAEENYKTKNENGKKRVTKYQIYAVAYK